MRYIAFITVLLLSLPQAFAGFTFSISNPAGNSGESITRDVFVTALAGDGFLSLTQAEFNLSASAGTTITSFAIDNAMTGNSQFFPASTATPTGDGTGLTGRLYSRSDATTAVANQVKLGQITLLLGSIGTATLTFNDPGVIPGITPSGNNVNVNSPFRNVDSNVFGSPQNVVNLSITAVPEPSSMLLLGAATLLFAFRGRVKGLLARLTSNAI